MKIAVAGIGYVGLSIATLLAQNNEVIAVDIDSGKVDMINNRKSPIKDKEIEEYLEPLNMINECVVVGRKAENSDTIILTAIVYPEATAFPEGATKEEMHDAIKAKVNVDGLLDKLGGAEKVLGKLGGLFGKK